MNTAERKFRDKTETMYKSIDGESVNEIENSVRDYVESLLYENGIAAEICGVALYGSRSRGLERPDSDIDVVIEFVTDTKEYVLFNILNEEGFEISGVPVDINPIRHEESGSLSEYLDNAEKYLSEKSELINDEIEYNLY